jgi:hypothetical protein
MATVREVLEIIGEAAVTIDGFRGTASIPVGLG